MSSRNTLALFRPEDYFFSHLASGREGRGVPYRSSYVFM